MPDRKASVPVRVVVRPRRGRPPVHSEVFTLGRRKAFMEQLEHRQGLTAAQAPRPQHLD